MGFSTGSHSSRDLHHRAAGPSPPARSPTIDPEAGVCYDSSQDVGHDLPGVGRVHPTE
jgi:hypothetical protein